jgi:hypothetical protein
MTMEILDDEDEFGWCNACQTERLFTYMCPGASEGEDDEDWRRICAMCGCWQPEPDEEIHREGK